MAQSLQSFQALERIVAPSTTPITLAEAKAQMRVETDDDDALITRLIAAAVAFTDAQGTLGKCMITQTWRQWVENNPNEVNMLMSPTITLTAVKYYDSDGALQTATLSDYQVLGPSYYKYVKVKAGFTWPVAQTRPDAIAIEYTVGYGTATTDVPETIRHALLMLVSHWYENREDTTTDRLQSTPFGFEELLSTERAYWYG
jgi:uncharacterized phiE125 gp8 family phage protein